MANSHYLLVGPASVVFVDPVMISMKNDSGVVVVDVTEKQSSETGARNIYLSAFGIHVGGGNVLMQSLLAGLMTRARYATLDVRLPRSAITFSPALQIAWVRKSMLARMAASIRIARKAKEGDVVFCFNSLPPLVRSRARVITFIQSPHYFGAIGLVRYPLLVRIRHLIERTWFLNTLRNTDEFWVQTANVRETLIRRTGFPNVKVVPFLDDELHRRVAEQGDNPAPEMHAVDSVPVSFFYPADYSSHKNHYFLVQALILLAQEGIAPKVTVTLRPHEFEDLRARFAPCEWQPLNIENVGVVKRARVFELMGESSALIFPSSLETFGLPLVEAFAMGKPILAPELDYVRDVCVPTHTFNERAPKSIARAIARFINIPFAEREHLHSTAEFVSKII